MEELELYEDLLRKARRALANGNQDGHDYYAAQAQRIDAERLKRAAEEREESVKRRRLEEEQEARDAAERLGDEILNREQVALLDVARVRARLERHVMVENTNARTPMQLDVDYFTRTARHLLHPDGKWLENLYPWITVGQAPPTHRIYTDAMQCFCLTSDTSNRAALLKRMEDSRNERDWVSRSMIQELFFDQSTIMPFFDVEPDNEKYESACVAPTGEGPTLRMVLELVVGLFPEWQDLAWIVWCRRSPTGMRYHIRVRGTKGECVAVDRKSFQFKVAHRKIKPIQGVRLPVRDWLGLDTKPYEHGQMRMSIGTKCTPEALTNMRLQGNWDLYTYHVDSVWSCRAGKVIDKRYTGEWPYNPESLWGAGALPWGTEKLIRPSRVPNASVQEIVYDYQALTSRLHAFGVPQHEHLEPATFSWNWRPRCSLRTALLMVDASQSRDDLFKEWKRIANHYCRVVSKNGIHILVLAPQPPAPHDIDRRRKVICDNELYKVEVHKKTVFVNDYAQFKKEWKEKEDGKTVTKKKTFADVVMETLDFSMDSMMYRQWKSENPESRVFNLWCGPGVTPDAAVKWVMANREKAKLAVRLFLEHMMWLCGYRHKNPKIDRYNMWAFTVLLHFTRKVLVDPFDRHQWEYILIMQGEPGCGKGTYWKLLQALVSVHMTYRVEGDASASRQMENFNAQFARHLVTLLDEPATLPMSLINSFKTLVTESQTGQEEKYDKNEMGQNLAHVLIFFNKLKSLPQLDQGERRIIITEGVNHPNRREFFDKVYGLLENDKGYHAIAMYLYTLKPNQLWESTMGSTPYTGPLKALMFDQSKPAISLLLSNAKSLAWYEEEMQFLFKPEPIGDDTPMEWKSYLELRDHTKLNHWIWRKMGEGFTEEWPPFVPLTALVKKLRGLTQAKPKAVDKLRAELSECLKTIWPTYVAQTWPDNPLYTAMDPVVDLGDLMIKLRASEFRETQRGPIHRNCQMPALNVACCDEPGWDNNVWQWVPWHAKMIKLEKMSGKVLLLPRKADAEEFYLQLFSTISDIPSVHFPRNWQIGRWDAFVDALGSDGGVEPLDMEDEEAYLTFEGVELGPNIGGRS